MLVYRRRTLVFGYVYRDLKPENILLHTNGSVQLADFGMSKKLKPGERTFTICGTAQYMSPEVLLHRGCHFEAGELQSPLTFGKSTRVIRSFASPYSNPRVIPRRRFTEVYDTGVCIRTMTRVVVRNR